MSKAFFRFLRGELNGYYITALNNLLNVSTEDIKYFLIKKKKEQLDKDSIIHDDLIGLGKFAGVFFPRTPLSESMTSVRMTDSHIVDGEEYSERGIFNVPLESFHFEHTEQNPSLPDINTLTDTDNRSSLVGDEPVTGYISANERDVITEDGNVDMSKVKSSPPESGAYSDFYSENFLFMSEGDTVYLNLPTEVFIELLKVMQWIRYNGVSLASFCKLIELICPDGMVLIDHINVGADKKHLEIYYRYNSEVATVDYKQQRISLFEFIVSCKFKQIQIIEMEV